MKICGLKLTHDSTIAVIEDDKLIFSIELEKINNNPRYWIMDDLSTISDVLDENGIKLNDIDYFSVDGWVGTRKGSLSLTNLTEPVKLTVAPYEEEFISKSLFSLRKVGKLPIGNFSKAFESYPHVLNHILSCYCTSSFAKRSESSYVLIWDGGTFPKMYFVNPLTSEIKNCDSIFFLGVNIYSIFAQHFRPFKINSNVIKDELSIAGKVMAYSSYGSVQSSILSDLDTVYNSTIDESKVRKNIPQYPYFFTKTFLSATKNKNYADEDILASFHSFLSTKLLDGLKAFLAKGALCKNLCFAGGAALNIRWNSDIRAANLFENLWICPFPNDSGSAIGAALAASTFRNGIQPLSWNVYSGPRLKVNEPNTGWLKRACSIQELAILIFESNEPVVILNDKAELGPRALGNRSIIANAFSSKMKSLFNEIKIRENYRPIAPICLENSSGDIFDPGTSDPYMLYTHIVKPQWREKLAAICHVDNTSRLQTVNESNGIIYEILEQYKAISGIPVLCNSSANYKGSGFFPDIYSATNWNKVNYIWNNYQLFEKIDKIKFDV